MSPAWNGDDTDEQAVIWPRRYISGATCSSTFPDSMFSVEIMFWPDPDNFLDTANPTRHTLFSWRNNGVTDRHIALKIITNADGTMDLGRRFFNLSSDTGGAREVQDIVCLGRWNHLALSWSNANVNDPDTGERMLNADKHKIWLNGEWFLESGVTSWNGSPDTNVTYRLAAGLDWLGFIDGASELHPWWGRLANFGIYEGVYFTDALAAQRWRYVCTRCGEPARIQEV